MLAGRAWAELENGVRPWAAWRSPAR